MKKITSILFLLLCCLRGWSSVSLTDGLIAYYTFSGNLNDSSSSTNNLTVTTSGISLSSDRFGNSSSALGLSSTLDYAQSDKNLGITGNVSRTMSVWVKSGYSTNHWGTGTILKFGDPTKNGKVNALKIESGASGRVEMWGQYAAWNAPNLFNIFENWTQIVYTYSDNLFNSKIYINGTEVPSAVDGMYLVTSFDITDTKLNIGHFYEPGTPEPNTGGYWDYGSVLSNGLIDDLRIYNRELSGSEVHQLYTLESAPEPSALSLLAVGLGGLAMMRRRRS